MVNGDTPTDRLVFPMANGDPSYRRWSLAEINGMLLDLEASILEFQETVMVMIISYQALTAPLNKEICQEWEAWEGGRWFQAESAMAQETHNGGDKEECREDLELDRRTYYLRGKTNITHRHRPTIQCQAVVSSHPSVIERVDCAEVRCGGCGIFNLLSSNFR